MYTVASCTETGIKSHHCTRCGVVTDKTEIPLTEHTPENWIIDVQPAVGTEGSRHRECSACHTVLETEAIPALPEESVTEEETTSLTTVTATATEVTEPDEITMASEKTKGCASSGGIVAVILVFVSGLVFIKKKPY